MKCFATLVFSVSRFSSESIEPKNISFFPLTSVPDIAHDYAPLGIDCWPGFSIHSGGDTHDARGSAAQ